MQLLILGLMKIRKQMYFMYTEIKNGVITTTSSVSAVYVYDDKVLIYHNISDGE